MSDFELKRFAQALCESCTSKKKCGKVLYYLLINRYDTADAAGFIFDIVTLDFFLDVEGDMHSFYSQLGELRERVQMLLVENDKVNAAGELVASDEDDAGNLR